MSFQRLSGGCLQGPVQTAWGLNPGPGRGRCTLGDCRQSRDGEGAGAPQALRCRPCARHDCVPTPGRAPLQVGTFAG